MMIICAAEEPIGPNHILLSWEELEDEDRDFPHDPSFERLNRYSFVGLNNPSRWEGLQPLLQALINLLPGERTWLSAWEHYETGDQRIRSLSKISIHRKAGWEMEQELTRVFARKPALWEDSSEHSWDVTHSMGTPECLVIGACPCLPILLASPLKRSLSSMAVSKHIVLDREIAAWLADHQLSIFSPQCDIVGRTGLVVVTPHRIPFHQLHAEGVIDMLEVENPAYVWRRPPLQL